MGVEGIEYGFGDERLERLLRSVDRPGNYCVGGRLYLPMPRVLADGVGELSFPVPESQIDALVQAAERAPYGKGTETLVDPAVRDCWQLDATQVRLAGESWPESFERIMSRVAEGLGLPRKRLGAQLYKLLVYRPGGFFAAHRDTEKVPGMVATLSLSLPARGAGGDLVVRHGDRETVFDMRAREPSDISFAAFYADCLHEVRPISEGHRVSLVFNLFMESGEAGPGAPDYTGLVQPVADCLARWRKSGGTENIVWLLDHEYTEDGLSFDALKNGDRTVAEVLAAAADRADCELHAAVLRVEEYGIPELQFHRWGDGWEVDESATDMDEVHERWNTLDGWAARDGSRPPFGRVELNDFELLPRGGLDEADPDESRFEESTGNEGPTLELVYRLSALVVWPCGRTVDIVAGGDIDKAVSWAAARCARVGDSGEEEVRRLLARLTDLWPIGDPPRRQNRAAMLELLRATGQAALAADFLNRIVTIGYDGSENDALVRLMPVIEPATAREFLSGFAARHTPLRPGPVFGFLAQAARRLENAGVRWRNVLSEAAREAFSRLPAALKAASRAPADPSERWPSHAGPSRGAAMDPKAVRDVFALAWQLGLADESVRAARTIEDHPKAVAPDRTLPQALSGMRRFDEGLADTPAYALLWRRAADFLLDRSSARPAAPRNWTVASEISCACEHCAKLRAFCEDPVARVERFKLRKDLRKHLHRIIDGHRLDLEHATTRRGSPYTLVCTKNRASFERRRGRYAEDLECIGSLLETAPERIPETERAERLERALAVGGETIETRRATPST